MARDDAAGRRARSRHSVLSPTLSSGGAALLEVLESRVLLSAAIGAQSPSGTSHPDLAILSRTNSRTSRPFSGPAAGYSPTTIRHAYGFDQITFGTAAGDGSGQTIAVVDAYNDPGLVSDLHTFDAQYGLPNPTITVVNQAGGTTLPASAPNPGNSWASETALDVEWAHVAAPGAKILVVEANDDNNDNLFAAVDTARKSTGVSVVSMSWGGDEFAGQSSYDSILTTPAGHTNVTFLAATGDNGAFSANTSIYTPEYPADSANVVAVGGTVLHVIGNNYQYEAAWGDGMRSGFSGGGGGGISQLVSQPTWQSSFGNQYQGQRTTPDVSINGSTNTGVPVYDTYDGGWFETGGTSLSAPLWAGIVAVVNQGRLLEGQSTLDGPSQTLPFLYSLPSSDFNDITSGSNGYAAGPGYDLATGLGTPIINSLVPDLVSASTSPVPLIGSFTLSAASAESGTTVTLTTANVHENGGSIAGVNFYLEASSTAGPQPATDTLIGGGAQNGTTWTINASTAGFAPGTYTYYAIATDGSALTTNPVATTLIIVRPTIGSFSVNPSAALVGSRITLSAGNVSELNGTVAGVNFYVESNGSTGLQTGTDSLLGAATLNGSTWTLSASTSAWAAGKHTLYAVATDSANISSLTSSAVLNITTPKPQIGSFTLSPTSVRQGSPVTLTANNVMETGGTVSGLLFYRDSNGSAGWQASDSLIGSATKVGNSWKLVMATAGRVPGTYTLFAVAVDSAHVSSAAVSAMLTVTPANDNFANATVISGTSLAVAGSNVGATTEAHEPHPSGFPVGRSVWWNWTASNSGTVSLNTHGSSFNTVLGVYTGITLTSLKAIATNNDDTANHTVTSALTFTAVKGTTYHILVEGYSGQSGTIKLNLIETVKGAKPKAGLTRD